MTTEALAAIELGATYRDTVTGFEGVATGKVEYLTGCEQAYLEGSREGGKDASTAWADVDRIELLEQKPKLEIAQTAAGGGERPHPRP